MCGDWRDGYPLETKEIKQTDTGNDLDWRVLGVSSKGELELISSKSTRAQLYLRDEQGYLNAESNLDCFCDDLYGHGIGAISARCLTADDVNKLTNYDPTSYNEYGVVWTLKFPTAVEKNNPPESEEGDSLSRTMWYRKDMPDGTVVQKWKRSYSLGKVRLPGEKNYISLEVPGEVSLVSYYYSYGISDLVDNPIIMGLVLPGEYTEYWLATKFVQPNSGDYLSGGLVGYVDFGMFNYCVMYSLDNRNVRSMMKCVRPVVTLSPNVQLEGGDNTTHTTEATAWEIK